MVKPVFQILGWLQQIFWTSEFFGFLQYYKIKHSSESAACCDAAIPSIGTVYSSVVWRLKSPKVWNGKTSNSLNT